MSYLWNVTLFYVIGWENTSFIRCTTSPPVPIFLYNQYNISLIKTKITGFIRGVPIKRNIMFVKAVSRIQGGTFGTYFFDVRFREPAFVLSTGRTIPPIILNEIIDKAAFNKTHVSFLRAYLLLLLLPAARKRK